MTPTVTDDPVARARLAHSIKSSWRSGRLHPDADAALELHPELRDDRSVLLDLVYEEFCLRRQAGEKPNPEEYQARFPGLLSALKEMFRCDGLLADEDTVKELNPTDLPFPLPGETFNRFTLLRELGRGAFAQVYLATESTTGDRPVAVKLTRWGGAEARTLGRLDHDHIVPVLWADRDPETRFYVVCMPWLGGATLINVLDLAYPHRDSLAPVAGAVIAEAIRRAGRPSDPPTSSCRSAGPEYARLSFVSAVCRMAEHLLEALAFLHGKRLAHCDLKPSNILMTPGGLPLLLDFNLVLGPDTATGVSIGGTPAYMAPEQIRACLSDHRLSPEGGARADLFALATVLYELLTGRHPLGDLPHDCKPAEMVPVVLERQQQPIRPIREWNPDVPPAVANLLHRCLAADPKDRPRGAAEVLAELRRFRSVARSTSLESLVIWKRGVALALLILAAALGGWGLTAGLPPDSPTEEGTLAQDPPWDARRHRQEAEHRMVKGWMSRYQADPRRAREAFIEAEKHFQQAISRSREENQAPHGEWSDYAGQGRALMLLGAFREAIGHFREAKMQFIAPPQRRQAEQIATAFGLSAHRLGSLAVGLEGLDPRYPRVLACLAYCETRVGEHVVAIEDGTRARQFGWKSTVVLNNLAYGYQGHGQFDQARSCADEVLRLDPNFLPALRTRIDVAMVPKRWKVTAELWIDVEHAIALSRAKPWSESGQLYLRAARVAARAAVQGRQKPLGNNPAVKDEDLAWQYVYRARLLGVPEERILLWQEIQVIQGKRTLPKPQREEATEILNRLLDPLDSELP